MASWLESIGPIIGQPTWTNRDASGLIRFARDAYAFFKGAGVTLHPFDWYAFALPALGWSKVGDKFLMDTQHQLQPYPAREHLEAALLALAGELDGQGVAFKLLADPRGTIASYKKLATDAWNIMKRTAAPIATPKPGDQIPLPHVTPTPAPGEATIQPVDEPVLPSEPAEAAPSETVQPAKKKKKNGDDGGAGMGILLLLVLAASGKRKTDRRSRHAR